MNKAALLEHLLEFISENKQKKFDEVVRHRTRYLTIVLEDIFQPHNASAVLRTCDCFGIQDVHIIENNHQYAVNPDVALGSDKWVNLNRYNSASHNTELCLSNLKVAGYRIVAASPNEKGFLLDELPLGQKTALVFGTEMQGLSDVALRMSDAFMKIPMYGFTESFNISVSAALSIYQLSEKLRKSDLPWQLSEDEIIDTKISWALRAIKNSGLILDRWHKAQSYSAQ